jgi:sugar phosphate isomerase/epimerase
MIKIGVNVDNWRHADKSLEYCLAFIAKQGVEYAELEASNGDDFIEGLGFSPYVSLNSDPIDVRKKAEKYGLKLSQIDVAFPINRWECIDYIRRGIIFSSLAGIPRVNTTDGATKLPGLSDTEQLGIIKYHLSQCVPVAENHQIIINVEPHGPFTNNPEMLLEIVTHFHSPYVRINFDTGNSFIAGKDPVNFLEQVADYVSHVHCKDVSEALAAAMRGKETGIAASVVPIGQGVNADNIAQCIRMLKQRNWDSVLSIETEGEENVKASIAWLRQQVAGNPAA